jgi:AsmA-like C-terminal region
LRRALSLAALALVLLAAGWWAYRTYASPDALRREIQARLSETLATPVSLGPVGLRVSGDGIELASEGFRAFPTQGEAALSAARVEVEIDLWAALLGEVRVRGLELTAPTLRLRRRAGEFEIDAPGGGAGLGLGGPPEVPGGESLAWYERLGRALPRLAVTAGRVVVVEGGGPGRDLAVEGLDGSFERRWLRGGIAVEAIGKLSAGGTFAGAFRLDGAFAEPPAFRLAIEELDLAVAAGLAGARSPGLALRGRATGTLRSEGERLVSVDLRGGQLHLEPVLAGRKLPLDLARAAIVASTASEAGGGERVTGEIRVGSLSVPFDASVSEGALARARLGPLDLAPLPPLADALREPERSELRRVLEHLRSGRLAELELSWPTGGRLALRARVEAAALAIGSGSRLEELSGEVRYDGDVLELQSAPARLDGEPLPSLDARLAGLAHVRGPSELRCVAPAPESALPGRHPLAAWITGDRKAGEPPSWKRLRVEVDWLEHPALLCAVERLAAEVSPDPAAGGGLRVALERATWAGVPIRGTASYLAGASERATLRLDVGPPFEPSAPELHRGAWAAGRFDLETSSLGNWKARGVSGAFRAEGTRLLLSAAKLRLDPGPVLDASAELQLGGAERVPVDVRASIAQGTLSDLYAAGGWTEQATGSLTGRAHLVGTLEPGRSVLADASGDFSLQAQDGVVRQRFRLLLAIAMASETLNPFRERGTIRYRTMAGEGRFAGGGFVIDSFTIDGPALRVAANGAIAATGVHETELVIGMFFFRTLDSVISRVPVLNRVLLGKEGNLVGAYAAVTGPWDSLNAEIIPTKTLMKGPVSFVFEGLPAFVRGSLRRVQTMLPAGHVAEPKEDS